MSRGLTLVELLVAVVVMAILGTALTRMLISDSRFVSRQDAMISARHAARAAMNTMAVEIRMVADEGLLAATPDSITARQPYAFGMTCQMQGTSVIASLVPPDSLTYASVVPDGMAWRDNTGTYTVIGGIKVMSTTESAACTVDSIRAIPGGMYIKISDLGAPPPPPSGQLFYLYQTVTYRFGASTELPGRIALWRKVGTAAAEEIVVPFDSAAGFGCLVGPKLTVKVCPPPEGIAAVRGLELRLVSASEVAPQGSTDPETFALVTQVPFLNKVN